MKTRFIFSMLICFLLTGQAMSQTVGISTGSSTGTYIKIGKDIADISSSVMDIRALPSKGSLQNIERILNERDYQYAIVQNDALKYYERNIDKDLKNKIKFIFPLYNEEVHVLVNKEAGIRSIRDLRGKKVGVGNKSSGNYVTATLIRQLLGISWVENNDNPKDALVKVLRGQIDAMIYVVGKPAKVFAEDLPEDAGDFIELLPFSDPALDDVYVKTTIEAGTYSWHKKTIDCYTTKAILVTYNYKWEPGKLERWKTAEENICKLVNQVNSQLAFLQANKHPKWKEVEPNLSVINWPVHPQAECAIKGGACRGLMHFWEGDDCSGGSGDGGGEACCVICDLQIDKAATQFSAGNYCEALKLYDKILDKSCCTNCVDLSVVRQRQTQSKERCNN